MAVSPIGSIGLPHVWVVRAGKHGQDEDAALDEGLVLVGFQEFGDLRAYGSVDAMADVYQKAYPTAPARRGLAYARQLWALREKIARGDTVVLPLKTRPGQIALGVVIGEYQHTKVRGQERHTRKVEWRRLDVPRSAFRQDLLHSFGAFSTVFRVQRNEAERRVQEVAKGGIDEGPPLDGQSADSVDADALGEIGSGIDLEQAASDEIVAFIWSRFQSHDMARLVEAILVAEGFLTIRSAPGRTEVRTFSLAAGPWAWTSHISACR